ncbi:MAG: signal recognition particle receptor subunit alpha, partial [Firmicutes bacterium]|nr:signal recognition particle receptor subunit alpha [Bacillota bacterium]
MLFRRKTKQETMPPQEQVSDLKPEETVSAEELAALGIEPDEETLPEEPAQETEPEPESEEAPAEEAAPEASEEPAPAPEPAAEAPKMSFFGSLGARIRDAMGGGEDLTDDFFDEMEEIFITSDIGMDTTMDLVFSMKL